MARRRNFIFLTLYGAALYLLASGMDELVNTEGLFPNTDGTLVAAIYLFVMGILTMAAARNKGREHIGWFACGTLFAPLPLLFILIIPVKRGFKRPERQPETRR